MINKLQEENAALVRQKDQINTSLALNVAQTEQAYYLFEIGKLQQIVDEGNAEKSALKSKMWVLF